MKTAGAGAIGVVFLAALAAGCRTMPADDRPFTESRTFHAATTVDAEPHVLNVTVFPPTRPLNFATPRRMALSVVNGTLLQLRDTATAKLFGRTLGVHSVGHVTVELKSTDPHTGRMRYLLIAVNTADPGEWTDQAVKQQVGCALLTRGVVGKLDTPDHAAADAGEPAELGTPAARLRVLLSPAAADRMFAFNAEFFDRGTWRRLALVSDPLAGDGASCASLAAAFLEAGGVFDPAWRAEWQRTLLVPPELMGDSEGRRRVPVRKLLVGPTSRRWAEPYEPHRRLAFYDTTRMHEWIVRHATRGTAVERQLEALLATPVATIDARHLQ